MSRTDNTNPPLTLDPQAEETRIRRALGLTGSTTHQQRPEQAWQRHRFVSDGAVPVVMLNRADSEVSGMKERLTAAAAALEAERAAHAQTRRNLHEAQAANQALQTQLGHAQLSHNEALAAERQARHAAEAALAELKAAASSAPEPEPEPEPAPRMAVKAARAASVKAVVDAAEPKRRGRKPGLPKPPREQKPVRWWTPSYRAKKS